MLFLTLLLALPTWCLWQWLEWRKWDHLPGYKSWSRLPLIGHSYKLGTKPIEALKEQCQKWGPFFRLDIGSLPTIFIADWKDANEAFKSEHFSGRPWNDVFVHYKIRGKDEDGNLVGVVASTGQSWRDHRKFLATCLRSLGMGNQVQMEGIILDEVRFLCEQLRKDMKTDGFIQVFNRFQSTTNTIVWRLLTGSKNRQSDPDIKNLTRIISRIFQSLSPSSLLRLAQQSSGLVCRLVSLLGFESTLDTGNELMALIDKEIGKHKPDPKGNIIERYLAQIEESKTDPKLLFNGNRGRMHMRGGIYDLFLAGTDTSAGFLEWFLYYITTYPDIQDQLYKEIFEQIGDRIPNLNDRPNTPYVNAFLEELMRHAPALAINVPHMTMQDTKFKGYVIPKGTQVFLFWGSIHFDSTQFQDPDTFNPNRFLTKDLTQFQQHRQVNAFGIGKRRCPGEALARPELYLIIVCLLQAFRFKKKHDLIPDHGCPKYVNGLLFRPVDFPIILEDRVTSNE